MKKFFRLVSLGLIPGLMVVFFNAVLAGPPVSKSQASEFARQTGLNLWVSLPLTGQGSLQTQSITGLSITHTSPAFAHLPTYFTATTTGTTLPLFYAWSFGDDDPLLLNAGAVTSHTYTITGTYTVVVTAFNPIDNVAQTASLTVLDPPYQVHLPVILKDFTSPLEPADLVCNLSLDPPAPSSGQTLLLTVQIQNQMGIADGFWVDLYVNPTTIPTTGHLLRWQDACGGPPSCPRGIAWSISDAPLWPGFTRTLVTIPNNFHPSGYDPAHSSWTGSLPAGTHDLYVYVDSIDNPELKDIEGAVFESNEGNNRCEILDLVVSAVNTLEVDERRSNQLPARPAP